MPYKRKQDSPMNILALDTAQTACSVAVIAKTTAGYDVAREFEWRPRGHAEVLASMIETVMGRAEMSYGKLDAIAVTIGPGSFTGLRVGLATARGIALAAEIAIISITSFEAVAANVKQETGEEMPVCVIFDARRGEVYVQVFNAKLEALTAPRACLVSDVAGILPEQKTIAIGSGVDLVRDALGPDAQKLVVSPALNVPDAAIFAHLALVREPNAQPPEPLYLRAPDAKPQKPPLARQEQLT
jgi:tRNA threonylcarbamoyladenosine biosynthesis protein TsaB